MKACQCEHHSHFDHEGDADGCNNLATHEIKTIYGKFQICTKCLKAKHMQIKQLAGGAKEVER